MAKHVLGLECGHIVERRVLKRIKAHWGGRGDGEDPPPKSTGCEFCEAGAPPVSREVWMKAFPWWKGPVPGSTAGVAVEGRGTWLTKLGSFPERESRAVGESRGEWVGDKEYWEAPVGRLPLPGKRHAR